MIGILLCALLWGYILFLVFKKKTKYKKSSYYQVTKRPYSSVRNDKGLYGEYLIYEYLEHFTEIGAKFLFNVYIPKDNGKTTEIDLLMICSKGIFVFESKNFSGWIFGDEDQKDWCQVLPTGRGRSKKFYFYNPIMQNHIHIKYIKNFLVDQIPMYSVIVFSDRCTLKNISIISKDVIVAKRHNINSVISEICNRTERSFLSEIDIDAIYKKLYPFTQVDAEKKEQHIKNIRDQINNKTEIVKQPDTKSMNQNIIKCPRCNGNLVLRTATQGIYRGKNFYGCSNYPNCRYIKNIENLDTTTKIQRED